MTERAHIAESFPANALSFDAMVAFDVDQRHTGFPDTGENGWSAPMWVTTAAGDTILGCYPQAGTYEEQMVQMNTDRDLAIAVGDYHAMSVDTRDLGIVKEDDEA